MAKIFESGATSPSNRLLALHEAAQSKFMMGVSMMPLLPYITDTKEEMEKMMLTFQSTGAKYIFPASITLFGESPSDSKTLVLNAVKKNYPHLLKNYEALFAGFQLPRAYQNTFKTLADELCKKYDISKSIIEASARFNFAWLPLTKIQNSQRALFVRRLCFLNPDVGVIIKVLVKCFVRWWRIFQDNNYHVEKH